MVELLRACVQAKLNIVGTGAPGAGRSTMLDVLRSLIPPGEISLQVQVGERADKTPDGRGIVLVEPHAAANGQGAITSSELLRSAVAPEPDRVVLERCSGPEARVMLEAMV